MGIKSPTKNHPQVPNAEKYPASSKKTCNRNITSYPLSPDNTLERGPLLGIMRPIWIKTTESEERLRWLRQMISRNLMVRDLEAFLRATSDKLRSDISKIREEVVDYGAKKHSLVGTKDWGQKEGARYLRSIEEALRNFGHPKSKPLNSLL